MLDWSKSSASFVMAIAMARAACCMHCLTGPDVIIKQLEVCSTVIGADEVSAYPPVAVKMVSNDSVALV